MKKIYIMKLALIGALLIGSTFRFAPASYAQSIQNWSKPVNLSTSGAATNPSIVVDNNGVINVLWVDKFDGYKFVKSADGGATWTAPKTVKYPFSAKVSPPVMLSDAKGAVHIFWLNDKSDFSYAQALANNLDVPTAWRVTKLDDSVMDFDVHIDSQNVLHVGYVKNPTPSTGVAGVFYRRSVGGGSWSAPFQLYESPYFRSLTPDKARIRLATSDSADGKKVYAVWDDQPQKRIYMATSEDEGLSWNSVQPLVTPQASLGFRTPYHAGVDILGDKLLVSWQVGDPGIRCTPYSWVSSDNGKTWSDPVQILAGSTRCPESSEFIFLDPVYSAMLFTIQGNLSLSAWNGNEWSSPEIQTGPSSITDSSTYNAILLGCERTAAYKNQFYVVGCDQGTGGDVWFISRPLDSLKNLFPLPSAWGESTNITTITPTITSLSSIADDAGNVHAFWVRASDVAGDPVQPRIMYSRWNGIEWTKPAPVITDLDGLPLNLSVQTDNNHKLLLSWVNQQTGDLMFTWANSERANNPLEWMQPAILSASSQSTDSPNIFVDASNRIVIAYAIALNEGRGIYVIQSTDLGVTWSTPVRVFDAVAANWQMVDRPTLAVTEDGRMHILFKRYSLLGGEQPIGLYYAQSVDGGATWTPPESVSEQSVPWSQLVAFKETLHRFWQEKNKSLITTYHQVSSDGGTTWDAPVTISNETDLISQPSVSIDWTGELHLLQVTQADPEHHSFQEWQWKNNNWQLLETRQLEIPQQDSDVEITSGVTTKAKLYMLLLFETMLNTESQVNVLATSRSLELTDVQPFLSSISTPSSISNAALTSSPDSQPQPTQTPLPAYLNDTQSSSGRNFVGISLVGIVVFFILIFALPRKGKQKI